MVRKNGPVIPLSPEEENCCPCPPTPPIPGPVVSVRSVNGKTGDVVLENLKIGEKTYNGSAAIEILPSDLDLQKAMVFRKKVTTIAKAMEFIEASDKVGDTCFCQEDKKFYMSLGEGDYLTWVSQGMDQQVDWNENDPTKLTFIKNKPDLTVFALKDEAGHKLVLSMDETTYELTATLYRKDNVILSQSTVDLPLEQLVKRGYYVKENKTIVLELYNGDTIVIPVSDLVTDLATKAELTDSISGVKQWVEDKNYLTEHQDISGKLNVLPKVDDPTDPGFGWEYHIPYNFEAVPDEEKLNITLKTLTLDNKVTKMNFEKTLPSATNTTAGLMSAADKVALGNKQNKLVAGDNITIDPTTNQISASGSKLTQAITTNVTVGGVQAGTTFAVGTQLEDIVRLMLVAQRTVQSIAITTPATKLTYSVGEVFNPSGMVVTATYSDSTSEVVTGYTYSPTTPLTLTDTTITVNYQGKTATQTITVEPNGIKVYKGLVSSVPTTQTEIEALTLDQTKDKSTLLSDGYAYKKINPDNQFVVLAIPNNKGIYCSAVSVGGFQIGINETTVGNYLLYSEDNPATLTNATYQYSFEEDE